MTKKTETKKKHELRAQNLAPVVWNSGKLELWKAEMHLGDLELWKAGKLESRNAIGWPGKLGSAGNLGDLGGLESSGRLETWATWVDWKRRVGWKPG